MSELGGGISEPEVASPCISVCVLDMSDICTGCYRSVDEIRAWSTYTNEQRQACKERALIREKELTN